MISTQGLPFPPHHWRALQTGVILSRRCLMYFPPLLAWSLGSEDRHHYSIGSNAPGCTRTKTRDEGLRKQGEWADRQPAVRLASCLATEGVQSAELGLYRSGELRQRIRFGAASDKPCPTLTTFASLSDSLVRRRAPKVPTSIGWKDQSIEGNMSSS